MCDELILDQRLFDDFFGDITDRLLELFQHVLVRLPHLLDLHGFREEALCHVPISKQLPDDHLALVRQLLESAQAFELPRGGNIVKLSVILREADSEVAGVVCMLLLCVDDPFLEGEWAAKMH